ncbi:MAG: peptidylprolyl isomerase [Patescibacteria group bacterium]|jgi:hypothetical protein
MPKYIDGVKKVNAKKVKEDNPLPIFSNKNKNVEKSASGIFYVAAKSAEKKQDIKKPGSYAKPEEKSAESKVEENNLFKNIFGKAEFMGGKKINLKNKFFKISEMAEKRMARQRDKIELKNKELAARKEQKTGEEKARLEKIAAEKKAREEKHLKMQKENKRQKNEIKKRKGMAKKAKAKLRAEKFALKLERKEEWKKKAEETKKKKKKAIKIIILKIKQQSRKLLMSLAVGAIITIAVLAGLSYSVYQHPVTNDLNQVLIRKLPFPAIFVNYRMVRYSQYFDDLRLLGDYYLTEAESSLPEGKTLGKNKDQLVLEKIIEKRLLENLANKYNVKVGENEVNEYFNKLSAAEGEENFTDKIYNQYGLTKKLFNEKIIYYFVLKDKIKEYFIKDEKAHQGANLRIKKVEELLKKNPDDFGKLAEKYSEDVHALNGGDIGYIKYGSMEENLKQSITGLNMGDTSEIIKEEDEYYILKVRDIKEGRDGQDVWLEKITIFTNYTFDKYLEDLRNEAKIWNLIK